MTVRRSGLRVRTETGKLRHVMTLWRWKVRGREIDRFYSLCAVVVVGWRGGGGVWNVRGGGGREGRNRGREAIRLKLTKDTPSSLHIWQAAGQGSHRHAPKKRTSHIPLAFSETNTRQP